eukprot:2565380-Amphidinium_carterae.1
MADVVRSSEMREAQALERAKAAEAEAAICREECAAARAALQDMLHHQAPRSPDYRVDRALPEPTQ